MRIGDVATLAKDRVSRDGARWRIFLHTEKTGKPVLLPDELRLALNAVPIPRGATPDCRYFFWSGISSEQALKGNAERTLAAFFRSSRYPKWNARTLTVSVTRSLRSCLGRASFEEVADVLGNSPDVVRKHYAK